MVDTQGRAVREAVGIFHSEENLQAAIDDLLTNGFDRADLSLLASDEAVREKLGHGFTSVTELEDNTAVPTTAYIATESLGDAQGSVIGGLIYVGALAALIPVVASGGAISAAVLATTIAGGTGGVIGKAIARVLGQRHADHIESQLRKGGLLLWVRTWDESDENRAIRILTRYSGDDVHVHGLPDEQQALEAHYATNAVGDARLLYRGEIYVRSNDREYYAFGKVFPSEDEIKAYIDRRIYLELMHTQFNDHHIDPERALADPSGIFETPDKLMATTMPDNIKIELLKRWAFDERELEMASDEGMPEPRSGDRLQEINLAISEIETGQ